MDTSAEIQMSLARRVASGRPGLMVTNIDGRRHETLDAIPDKSEETRHDETSGPSHSLEVNFFII